MSCSKHYASSTTSSVSAKQQPQPTSTTRMYQQDHEGKEQQEHQKFSSSVGNDRENRNGQNISENGGGTPTEEWEEDFEDFKEEVNLMELSDEEPVDGLFDF